MFNPLKFLASPHDPCQQPSHRWLRCLYLRDYRRPPTPDDDALTHTAYAFLRDWQRCRDAVEHRQLAEAHPILAEAHRLYQTASVRQTAEVEARLLAGESDDRIAEKCNLSAGVIHLFHELFFDVRPYLQASAYITNLAIGPTVHQGLKGDDYDVLLKIAGYTLGAAGVDELLAYWAHPPIWPLSLAQLDDAALESLRAKLRMQAWILSLTLPADADTAARLHAIRQVLAQAGVLGKGSASDENSLLSACRAALDFRTFLSARGAAALTAAQPAHAEEVSEIREHDGLAIPDRQERQAVPA